MRMLLRGAILLSISCAWTASACAQSEGEIREKIRTLMQEAQELAKLGDDEEAHRIRTKIAELLEEHRGANSAGTQSRHDVREGERNHPGDAARGYQGPRERMPIDRPSPPRHEGFGGFPPRVPQAPFPAANQPWGRLPGSYNPRLGMALEHMRLAEFHFQGAGMRELAEQMHRQREDIQARFQTPPNPSPMKDFPGHPEARGEDRPRESRSNQDDQQWIRESLHELREENRRLREMMREMMEQKGEMKR